MRMIRWLMVLLCLCSLGLSVSAYADTYNFFFKQKKDKNKAVEVEEEEDVVEETPPAPAVTPNAPIVINNNNHNHVGTVTAAPSQVVTPVSPTPSSTTSAVETVAALPELNPWTLTLSPMLLWQDFDYTYSTSSGPVTYPSRVATWGGLVTLGYRLSPGSALKFYGGGRYKGPSSQFVSHLGADFELIPFRLGFSERWNLFELAFLAGASNAMAARGNFASLHGGARANINLGPDFGITAGARANLGYIMLEAGLVARL